MRIALVGYGEVGRILGEDLRQAGHEVTAFDLHLTSDGPMAKTLRAHAAANGVELASSHVAAVSHAALVVSAVTAHQAVAAAEAAAGGLQPSTFFLDLNSASPAAKIAASGYVERAKGRYVEGAVMTAVPPYRLKVPLLLGGPHAEELAPLLTELGFAGRVGSRQWGTVSATKMCRSVVIKGLEALLVESFSAARFYGVEEAVLASLQETFPGIDWQKQGTYFFQRTIEHGRRRAEEMREVAVTVREAGLPAWGSSGAAERHAWVADLTDRGIFGQRGDTDFRSLADWRIAADRILQHLAAHDDQENKRP